MIKVKDGYAKLIGTTYLGSASRVLLSNGGDHVLGNASGNIPLSNGTVNTNLNADLLDGLHGSYYAAASSLSNYLPLAGGTMQSTASIYWRDRGAFSDTEATYPYTYGGLKWSGTSDFVHLYAEESSRDLLKLVLNFGDDANPTLSIRLSGTEVAYIGANGKFYGSHYQSYVATGTQPYACSSTTLNTNLNADMLDGVHLAGHGGRYGVMRSWSRGSYTTVNLYFGNGNIVVIDPKPTDDSTLSANTIIFSLGDSSTRNTLLAFMYERDEIKYRRATEVWNAWKTIAFTDSSISGNAASATKLQTARTLTVGNSAKTFDGSANVSWPLHDILYNTNHINTSTSWDIYTPGVYYVASTSAFTGTNNPESANGGSAPYRYGLLIVSRANDGGVALFYISHHDSYNTETSVYRGIKFRTGWKNSYLNTWRTLLDTHNYSYFLDSRYYTETEVNNKLAGYLPLSGGTMTGCLKTVSFDHPSGIVYGGAIEIREKGYVTTNQTAWEYSPAISFHWGGRHIKRLGLASDGHLCIDNNKIWTSANDGSGSGLDADLLDGTHKSGLLTALSSSSSTNISVTVGDTTKSVTNAYAKFGVGTYTSGGGEQRPSYIGSGLIRWNMMRATTTYFNSAAYSGYCDWMMMDTYTGSDVPYVTMIGVLKAATPHAYIASGSKGDSSGKWNILTLLDSNNSSISGDGGSTWGSSITVKINGTSKTLTIPSNPNTDYQVKQSATTTSNYRAILVGTTSNSNPTVLDDSEVTGQAYVTEKFYLQPSTGTLFTGRVSIASNQYVSNSSYGIFMNNSDITGCNSIYFGDLADDAGEGIHFYRSSTTWDSLTAKNGVLYFSAGRASTDTTLTSIFSSMTNTSNLLDITIGGLNRKLTIAYATSANSASSATKAYYLTGDSISNLNSPQTWSDDGSRLVYNTYSDSASNKPASVDNANGVITLFKSKHATSGLYATLIAATDDGNLYVRYSLAGSWKSWKTVAYTGHTHSYLPLSGGTLTGSLHLSYATSATMTTASTNPQIIFSENGGQKVQLMYTDYDSYRSPAGLKVLGEQGGEWFEVVGNCYAAHFYENSDIKLKTNIESISTTDNIPQLKKFNWKIDGSIGYGLIAQELEEMGYSELVDTSGEHKTVKYSAALSLIVGKLQVKIKELEKEIENLKNKN